MNIEEFIKREDIDKNYHAVAKLENTISQSRAGETEPLSGLYNLEDLDFMYRTCDSDTISKNRVFTDFRKRCVKTGKRHRDHQLIFSGPLIKSIVDPYYTTNKRDNDSGPHIRNEIMVLVVSEYSTLECLSIKKSNQVESRHTDSYDSRLFYQVDIGYFSFFVRKKSYSSIAEAIVSSNDPLDRIALVGDTIYVSGLFVLEYYNRMRTYDPDRVDPVFGYPTDILNVYDRQSCIVSQTVHGLFKTIIDRADIGKLSTLVEQYNSSREKQNVHPELDIESTMIIEAQQKYSVIEYLMLQMTRSTHMVILQTYRDMFVMLISHNYRFIRSPIIFARVNPVFMNRFPSLVMILENVKQIYPPRLRDIPPSNVIELGISSMYHIDMYLIKSFIRADDETMFVDYITRIKMVKKLSNLESKTARMIIDWLIAFNSQKIISTLIETRTLVRSDVFRLIFLTESFNLLDDDIVDYIRYKAKKEKEGERLEFPKDVDEPDQDTERPEDLESDSVTDSEKEIMNRIEEGEILDQEVMEGQHTNSHDRSESDLLADELDEEIDAAIETEHRKDRELQERLDQIEEDEEMNDTDQDNKDRESHESNNSDQNSDHKSDHDSEKESEDSAEDIDPDDVLCILHTLEEVIRSGISHSFFLIHQICPNILDDDFLESMKFENPVRNIIHWAKSDDALEVLQLMLKFRPDIVNSRNDKNLTPLLSLVETYDPKQESGSIEKIMVHLLTNEADYEDTNADGDTILHILARKGDTQLVNTVLRLVPSIINHQNNKMMTPLMVAAESGDESMVYALEGGNADTSYTDRDGNSVYHYICRSGICPNSIVRNRPNHFGFRPSDYSLYCEDFYYFR